MRFNVGDRVRIKNFDWFRNEGAHNMVVAYMKKYYGEVVTIKSVHKDFYRIKEDDWQYCWTDEMIEGLAEEETKSELKFKVGDKVRIKSLDWYNENKDEYGCIECSSRAFFAIMCQYCGKILTINGVDIFDKTYKMIEDGCRFDWTDEMIECKVEEDNNMSSIDKLKRVSTPAKENWFEIAKEWEREDKEMDKLMDLIKYYGLKHEVNLPEGYQFKDENGNVINAQKIVLEKKKNEYPKTYEECCKILNYQPDDYDEDETLIYGYMADELRVFQKLLVCRNAYWKLAGEEMGLGKPWKPDWNTNELKYIIYYENDRLWFNDEISRNTILAFPTEEMRDAFYDNFKSDIEFCKELL